MGVRNLGCYRVTGEKNRSLGKTRAETLIIFEQVYKFKRDSANVHNDNERNAKDELFQGLNAKECTVKSLETSSLNNNARCASRFETLRTLKIKRVRNYKSCVGGT
jgi:hypothetical protein